MSLRCVNGRPVNGHDLACLAALLELLGSAMAVPGRDGLLRRPRKMQMSSRLVAACDGLGRHGTHINCLALRCGLACIAAPVSAIRARRLAWSLA